MHRIAFFVALILSMWAAPGRADFVSFEFGGLIQSVLDTHGVLDGSIVPAGRIHGRVQYDANDTDLQADPGFGSYMQNPPVGQLRVDIGSYTLEVPADIPVRYSILDDWRFDPSDPLLDSFAWSMEGNAFPFPGTPSSVVNIMWMILDTHDTTVLASDSLPPEVLDISDFPNQEIRRFGITGCLTSELDGYFCDPEESIEIFGIIDMLPEPALSASNFAVVGALTLLARRSRCSRRARRHISKQIGPERIR